MGPETARMLGGADSTSTRGESPTARSSSTIRDFRDAAPAAAPCVRDELYQIKDFSRDRIRVLAHLDASKLDLTQPLVHRTDGDFPGRVGEDATGKGGCFYSILGHDAEAWDNPVLQQMYFHAIRWALRLVDGDATPPAADPLKRTRANRESRTRQNKKTWQGPPGATMPRVGLIGYGYAGRTFHAPLIRATPGLALVAVSSSRPERVLADLPGIAVVPSADDLLAAPSIDLVVIAAPSDVHAPLAAAALRAGKHVVVDKPIAPTLDEARATAMLATGSDRVLAVFQNRRWDGDFLALRICCRAASSARSRTSSRISIATGRWCGIDGASSPAKGRGSGTISARTSSIRRCNCSGLPDRVWGSLAAQRAGSQVDDWAHVVLEYNRRRAILHASVLVAAPAVRFVVHGRDWQLGSNTAWTPRSSSLVAALTPAAPSRRENLNRR
jgi:predicted dehydrogenase